MPDGKLLLVLGTLLWIHACGVDPGTPDAGLDAGRTDAGDEVTDAGAVDAGPAPDAGPEPVAVAHTRELRGAWVASVFNITWPSNSSLSETASRQEIVEILSTMQALNMNAVFVQVRPESDALYASTLEPWSRSLTGSQGQDPGWDPLAVWLEEGHARGIEIHAWMNPYRGMASASAPTASNHVTQTLSQHAHTWNTTIWMDPGAPEVRAHVIAVIEDLLARYDVDGVHFDDYFYPYPGSESREFPDDATYAAHGAGLDRDAWRRQNVDTMVQEVSAAIAAARPDVRFGISPFGIHRPGMPPGINGLDAYAVLHTDAPHWLSEGWVDYLAPQLYWPSTQAAQAFGPLVEWWSAQPRDPARSILSGLNLARLGDDASWSVAEFRTQVELTRGQQANGARGSILYTIEPVLEDRDGIRALFAELYAQPAATPPMAGASVVPPPPAVTASGATVSISASGIRSFAVYRDEGGYVMDRLVPAGSGSAEATLTTGRWAISSIDRRGQESLGVPLEIE